MIGRKTVIGLTMLCALLVSAFAAQSASAVASTAHTCKLGGTGTTNAATFSDEHCKVKAAGQTGAYKHIGIAPSTTTEIIGTDVTTAPARSGATLKATVAGSAIELVAKEVHGTGSMENLAAPEMQAAGFGEIKYTNVTENLLGCKVTGKPGGAGVVETKKLAASTLGAGMGLKFTPQEGTLFAELELTECIIGPITIKVFGSVLGATNGATTTTVHNTITGEKSLRLQNATTGPIAGIDGTLTISGREKGSTGAYTPLSVTTENEF
jgi:hypothetical protein